MTPASGRHRALRDLYQALTFQAGQKLIELGSQLQRAGKGEAQHAAEVGGRPALGGGGLDGQQPAHHAVADGKAADLIREYYGRVSLYLGHDGMLHPLDIDSVRRVRPGGHP